MILTDVDSQSTKPPSGHFILTVAADVLLSVNIYSFENVSYGVKLTDFYVSIFTFASGCLCHPKSDYRDTTILFSVFAYCSFDSDLI